MAFTIGEAVRLEKSLVIEGAAERADPEAIISGANAWFNSQPCGREILDTETFAFLCEVVRFPADATARALAVGALRAAERDGSSHPHRAAFAVRFAAQRIRALGGRAPLWSAIPLSPRDEMDARALFEAAQGDRSYADGELVQCVTTFVAKHREDESMFGRLATDLSRLVDVMMDSDGAPRARETARAALTYFAVADDAIADETGFVGLLDDLYVVQRAVAEIDPGRGTIVQLLDELVRSEPLIRELRFDANGSAFPLTEFGMVNCALLLNNERPTAGIAAIVPRIGPLAALVGFVTAMSRIRASLDDGGWPDFRDGELLTNSESGASVIFHSYGRLVDKTFERHPAVEATHICFIARSAGRGKSRQPFDVKCFRPIEDILSFRRAAPSTGAQGGSAIFDRDNLRLGLLERLLASAKPLVLPAIRDRVLVVSTLSEAKATLQELKMFGSPVLDFLPIGQAQVGENGAEYRTWGRANDGQGPVLTFVRSTADAAVLCDDSDNRVAAVVAPVREGVHDIASLTRIADRGTPVLALAEQRNAEAVDHLHSKNFSVWVWDDFWLNAVHWPSSDSHFNVIRDYEIGVRDLKSASIQTFPVSLEGIAAAHAALERLRKCEGSDGELLQLLIEAGVGLLLRLCRLLIPATTEMRGLGTRLLEFKQAVTRGARWWSDDVVALTTRCLDALDQAFASLERHNPKFEALAHWATCNPEGQIVCQRHYRAPLATLLDSRSVSLVDRPHGKAPVLVPAWLQRERMNRLLFPPVAPSVALLLYEPEQTWHAAADYRYRDALERAGRLALQRPAFRRVAPMASPTTLTPTSLVLDPDDFVLNIRRTRAVNYMQSIGGEAVPARLVQFAGGYWAAFTDLHRLHTVTHLATEHGSEDEQVRETVASELVQGDLVLLVRGTDRDALREAVDSEAPEGLRHLATTWQRSLQRHAYGRATNELVDQLAKAGCRRTVSTIERWLVDESMIGPRSIDDVRAILTVTRDSELNDRVDACLGAISNLRGLHVKMAGRLAARVRDRAREWLDAGAVPDELVEVEDRLVVVTVEAIHEQPLEVPRSLANRLQSDRLI